MNEKYYTCDLDDIREMPIKKLILKLQEIQKKFGVNSTIRFDPAGHNNICVDVKPSKKGDY